MVFLNTSHPKREKCSTKGLALRPIIALLDSAPLSAGNGTEPYPWPIIRRADELDTGSFKGALNVLECL